MDYGHCLYGKGVCQKDRHRDRPFCKQHYVRLMREIEEDLNQMIQHSPHSPIEVVDQAFSQAGGNILKAASKIGTLVGKHSGKIAQGLSKASASVEKGLASAEKMANRAEALSQTASQISSQVEGITGQIGSLTGSFDSNYGQNQLAINSPLGSQGNFQSFGDYVCIKKTFLADLRTLLFELLAKREEV